MGTPEFSVPVLKMLIDNTEVIGVVTKPDAPVGRKKVIKRKNIPKKRKFLKISII